MIRPSECPQTQNKVKGSTSKRRLHHFEHEEDLSVHRYADRQGEGESQDQVFRR
ncbi:hypothetical protein PO124_34735 [Bacillus licheniformis]|nr:hypothetical protein [Bacillus licheniformis]